ncbi:MAG: hypothetical protein J5U17_11290 [Candidatus Methanoperedens sp.]|nr:hypothetical protein [Candidatus Methanoperedens sp.]MCE8426346.1 hypothetical protein [Candidatus Methanoperedens sp.]
MSGLLLNEKIDSGMIADKSCCNNPFISNIIALVALKEKPGFSLIIGTSPTIAGIWIII